MFAHSQSTRHQQPLLSAQEQEKKKRKEKERKNEFYITFRRHDGTDPPPEIKQSFITNRKLFQALRRSLLTYSPQMADRL